MLINKLTTAEFESKQQAKAMSGFASAIASKICAIARGNLGIPLIQTGSVTTASFSAKEYIETISNNIKYKIGIQFDENCFLAIGVDSNFVTKCSYYWAGGRLEAPTKEDQGSQTTCELAFLRSFISYIQPMIQSELNKRTVEECQITVFDDSVIAFKNEQRVQINTVKCSYGNEEVQIAIITSDGVLNYCDLNSDKENNQKQKISCELSKLSVNVEARIEANKMTLGEIKTINIGQEIDISTTFASLINKADMSVIGKGIIGYDNNQQLIKIQELK